MILNCLQNDYEYALYLEIKNWNVKKCGNCGRYFLTPKETISYCYRIFSGNITCREYGNMDYQRKKRELDDTYRKYRDISAKLQTRITRGKKKMILLGLKKI